MLTEAPVPDHLRLAAAAGAAGAGHRPAPAARHRTRPAARSDRGAPAGRSGEPLRGGRSGRGDHPRPGLHPPARAQRRRARLRRHAGDPPGAAARAAAEPATAEGAVHRTVPAAPARRGARGARHSRAARRRRTRTAGRHWRWCGASPAPAATSRPKAPPGSPASNSLFGGADTTAPTGEMADA